MERNLNNEDFEEFLKGKTDNYKLYPSDNVWKGIYQSLHTRKKWFRIGGSLLFLSTVLFITYQFNDRSAGTSAQTLPQAKYVSLPVHDQSGNTLEPVSGSIQQHETVTRGNNPAGLPGAQMQINASVAEPAGRPVNTGSIQDLRGAATTLSASPNNYSETKISDLNGEGTGTIISGPTDRVLHDRAEINWLQEMAAMRLIALRRNRFNLQFYFSPTISYRKLTDGNKTKELSNVPLATNQLGVNSFVDHKPAIGVELGSNLLFSPSKKLTLKTGLQLNYSRYTIKAYKFYFEKANIALVTSGRIADTVSSYTSLRNFNGYFPEELQNQYLQLSLPVGAELKLIGNKRLQLNVAGTVQPSYLLYNDTYLLSTDFINYTKEPTLVRKWNVNTSAEAFVSYYIGGMRWQVGPQFRYQTLSSYNDRYPIREYLIEYGVKFGVSKTLR